MLQSVCQSAMLSRPIWGPRPDFCYRQLRVWWCGAPSLTRGSVCRLQLLLVLASVVILGSESHGTHDHVSLSQIWDSPNLEGRSPYLYPSGTGWPSYTPRRLLRRAGLRWRYSNPPLTCPAYNIGTDRTENTVPLLLFTGRCVITTVL
jgi:hypothetical protein